MSYLFSKSSQFYKDLSCHKKEELNKGLMQGCSSIDVRDDMNKKWAGMGDVWLKRHYSINFNYGRDVIIYSVYEEKDLNK